MISIRGLKISVILFSLTGGSLLVWQLSQNLAGPSPVQGKEAGARNEPVVMPVSSKSIRGTLDMGKHLKPDSPKDPMLSGSKSVVIVPIEAVTIPGIPIAPSDKDEQSSDHSPE